MSVPEENLNKCTLLVQRRSQALIDYYTMLFPPHFIYQSMQEREREIEIEREREREDMTLKVQSINKHIFMKGKQNISSLHKTICGLVSLFL